MLDSLRADGRRLRRGRTPFVKTFFFSLCTLCTLCPLVLFFSYYFSFLSFTRSCRTQRLRRKRRQLDAQKFCHRVCLSLPARLPQSIYRIVAEESYPGQDTHTPGVGWLLELVGTEALHQAVHFVLVVEISHRGHVVRACGVVEMQMCSFDLQSPWEKIGHGNVGVKHLLRGSSMAV